MEIPTSLYRNNIKHVKIIRATLKTYKTYANKIHYQIDHDFRNLTKLVWYFCDLSTFHYQFYKITSLEQNTKPERISFVGSASAQRETRARGPEEDGGSRGRAAQARGGARVWPQAVAHGAASTTQRGAGVSGPDGAGGGPASRPTRPRQGGGGTFH